MLEIWTQTHQGFMLSTCQQLSLSTALDTARRHGRTRHALIHARTQTSKPTCARAGAQAVPPIRKRVRKIMHPCGRRASARSRTHARKHSCPPACPHAHLPVHTYTRPPARPHFRFHPYTHPLPCAPACMHSHTQLLVPTRSQAPARSHACPHAHKLARPPARPLARPPAAYARPPRTPARIAARLPISAPERMHHHTTETAYAPSRRTHALTRTTVDSLTRITYLMHICGKCLEKLSLVPPATRSV